jgi:hypothetical protein
VLLFDLSEKCKVRIRSPHILLSFCLGSKLTIRHFPAWTNGYYVVKGMSGRSLRRLPILAHARHIGVSSISHPAPDVEVWLKAMELVVLQEAKVRGAEGAANVNGHGESLLETGC